MLYYIDGQLVMGQITVSQAILKTQIPGTRYFAVLASTTRYRYLNTGIVRSLAKSLRQKSTTQGWSKTQLKTELDLATKTGSTEFWSQTFVLVVT